MNTEKMTIYENMIEEYSKFVTEVQNIHAQVVERTQQHNNFIKQLNFERFDSLTPFLGAATQGANGYDVLSNADSESMAKDGHVLSRADVMKLFNTTKTSAISQARKVPVFMNDERALEQLLDKNREQLVDIEKRERKEDEEYAVFMKEQEKDIFFGKYLFVCFENELEQKKLKVKQWDDLVQGIIDIKNNCDKNDPEDVERAKMAAMKEKHKLNIQFPYGYSNTIKRLRKEIANMEEMLATYNKVSDLYKDLVKDGTNSKINENLDELYNELTQSLEKIENYKIQNAEASEFIVDIVERPDSYEVSIHSLENGKKRSPYVIDKKEFTKDALNDFITKTYLAIAFEERKNMKGAIKLNGKFLAFSSLNNLIETDEIKKILSDNEKNIIKDNDDDTLDMDFTAAGDDLGDDDKTNDQSVNQNTQPVDDADKDDDKTNDQDDNQNAQPVDDADKDDDKTNDQDDNQNAQPVDDNDKDDDKTNDQDNNQNTQPVNDDDDEDLENITVDRFNKDRVYYKVTSARRCKNSLKDQILETAVLGLAGAFGGLVFGNPLTGTATLVGAAMGVGAAQLNNSLSLKKLCRNISNRHYIKKLEKLVDKINKKYKEQHNVKDDIVSLKFVNEKTSFNWHDANKPEEVRTNEIVRPALFMVNSDRELTNSDIDQIENEIGVDIQVEINKIFRRPMSKMFDVDLIELFRKKAVNGEKTENVPLPIDMLHFGFAGVGGIKTEDELDIKIEDIEMKNEIGDMSETTNCREMIAAVKLLNPRADIIIGIQSGVTSEAIIYSSVPGEKLDLPKGLSYNTKNGITNKHISQSGLYITNSVVPIDVLTDDKLQNVDKFRDGDVYEVLETVDATFINRYLVNAQNVNQTSVDQDQDQTIVNDDQAQVPVNDDADATINYGDADQTQTPVDADDQTQTPVTNDNFQDMSEEELEMLMGVRDKIMSDQDVSDEELEKWNEFIYKYEKDLPAEMVSITRDYEERRNSILNNQNNGNDQIPIDENADQVLNDDNMVSVDDNSIVPSDSNDNAIADDITNSSNDAEENATVDDNNIDEQVKDIYLRVSDMREVSLDEYNLLIKYVHEHPDLYISTKDAISNYENYYSINNNNSR